MKKGYIAGMVLAVLVITIGIFTLSNKGNINNSVNGSVIVSKIEKATNNINSYYSEINITGAVGEKKGSYIIKQWYKNGKVYSENYILNKKQKLTKTSVSLKDDKQTIIYNIDAKNAIVTNTKTDKSVLSQDGSLVQFPLELIKNIKDINATLTNNQYVFDIVNGDYKYKVSYDKTSYMPINLEINYQGKFLSAIEFKKLNINVAVNDQQLVVNIPSDIKVINRNYSNENSDITKIRTQVKFPVLIPSFLPSGYSLGDVTKEEFDNNQIVNLIYKGAKQLKIIESKGSKVDNKTIPASLKKINVGKYKGYLSSNGDILSLSWVQGNTSVILYGEFDEATLLKIATSLR